MTTVDARVKYAGLIQDFDEKLCIHDYPKSRAIAWILQKITSCQIRENLVLYLKEDDIHLKRAYYHIERKKAIFYFKVYDGSKKEVQRKKVALDPVTINL